MDSAARIIDKFGGIHSMARKMGVPPSTVQGWKERGVIPARRQPDVIEVARREEIDLSYSDFFDAPDREAS